MMLWKDVKRGLDHDSCHPSQVHCRPPDDVPVAPVPLPAGSALMGAVVLAFVGVRAVRKVGRRLRSASKPV